MHDSIILPGWLVFVLDLFFVNGVSPFPVSTALHDLLYGFDHWEGQDNHSQGQHDVSTDPPSRDSALSLDCFYLKQCLPLVLVPRDL